MEVHDPAAEKIHSRLEATMGEPEATLLMDRLATRDDIRAIVRDEIRSELSVFESQLRAMEARLEAKIQSSGRQQMLSFVAIMTFLNGMLGGILTLAQR